MKVRKIHPNTVRTGVPGHGMLLGRESAVNLPDTNELSALRMLENLRMALFFNWAQHQSGNMERERQEGR